jgi:hypothetical protein
MSVFRLTRVRRNEQVKIEQNEEKFPHFSDDIEKVERRHRQSTLKVAFTLAHNTTHQVQFNILEFALIRLRRKNENLSPPSPF